MSTYAKLSAFVASWGFIYFAVIFVIAVAYALAPKNRKKFEEASRIPFEEE
jgi:cytochrome c oxidase cbb3-type subunit IV